MKKFLKRFFLLSILAAICIVSMATWHYYKPESVLPNNFVADKVVVLKSKRELQLLRNDTIIKTYTIDLGANPIGHKRIEGDEKTPEGNYTLDWRNPNSVAFLSLHISYPNEDDKAFADSLGKSSGGNIMIHGLPNNFGWMGRFHTFLSETDGCISVTNEQMQQIYDAVPNNTPIEILP